MSRAPEVYPKDAYNQELLSNVHPPDYENPEPSSSYNLVVIGAGTAGLVSAAAAAGLGATVALVEKNLMGGDCLNVGCVPSKAFIRSARAHKDVDQSADFGIEVASDPRTDFSTVMERLRRLRAGISHHDSVERFSNLGIDVFLGEAKFRDRKSIVVGDRILPFKKAVIATGASAVEPPIDGLAGAGYLTNESVFSLTEQPRHLLVIGGGPIGCELAQSFRRLGSEVTLVETSPQFLSREDPDAAQILERSMRADGVELLLNSKVQSVRSDGGRKKITIQSEGQTHNIIVDEILVGVGRQPNVHGLNLEAAGVEYDQRKGVHTNDLLQTSNSDIYAAGDITLKYKFTHTADAAARILIQNAFFFGRKKVSNLTVPWCTYTSPEIAHVGLYEREAKERGIELDTFQVSLDEVDRAILEGQEEGFVKIHVKKGSDEILGATIVAEHAGEMLSEITLAIVTGVGLGKIADVIHPYPTQAEAIRKVADQYNRTRLTPFVKKLFEKWFRWLR